MADPIIHYTFDTDGTNSGSLGSSLDITTIPSDITFNSSNQLFGGKALRVFSSTNNAASASNRTIIPTWTTPDSFTFSQWIKIENYIGMGQSIMEWNVNGLIFALTSWSDSTTLLVYYNNTVNTLSIPDLFDNEYHHFLFTVSANSLITVYIDSVSHDSIQVSNLTNKLVTKTYIGSRENTDPCITGYIDDFRIYDYALNTTQIRDLYIEGGIMLIKIHENFTISDGTSSSAFTTDDADYRPTTFATKLSADLAGNTVTFGTTGGSGYLEFANAATLTGMPNYIFVILFGDFSMRAGGRVNFRNVNLDADMTITASSVGPLALIGESIYGEAIGDNYGVATALSADGTIMAVGSPHFKVATDPLINTGMVQVYIRTNNIWAQIGEDIVGAVYNHPSGTNASGEYFGTSVSLSADGTILAVGSPHHHDIGGAAVVAARVYKNINNIWTQLGGDIDENMGSAGETVSLSADGNTLALSIPNQGYWVGRVKIYTYVNSTTWTQLGQDMNGVADWLQFSRNMVLSADGNTVAIGAFDHTNGSHYGRVEIRKYVSSTNTWTLVGGNIYGNKEKAYFGNSSTNLSISLSTDGTIVAIVANGYPQSQVVGYTQVYEYKTPSTNWTQVGQDIDATGDIIISGDGIIVMVGANMYKYVNNEWTLVISIPDTNSLTVSAHALSSDGTTVVLGNHTYNSFMGFVSAYKLPGPVSITSTIPAGDSFINNFVSKISTDINQSLSYDADNKNITFDGISENIEISITSTDTTVFDTSITEITVAENTLPFITYGQPEPNYGQDGVVFLGTIKIHENFTISDGISSSAFTTGDADYTQITFANKLSANLAGNTVTFGATAGSGCLEFANETTLTGMPNYIFAIPFSDFSVKAGGRVNFRNVNLDADMTIATIKREQRLLNNEAVFTSNSDIIDAINLTNNTAASTRWVNDIDHYTNIINDDTLFPTTFSKVDINYDGSIIACGKNSLGTLSNGAIQVYKRDTTASSGWIQIGSTIFGDDDYDQYSTYMTLSYDGQIVAGTSVRAGGSINGYFQAWKQDPSNTSVEPIGWTPHGDKLLGSSNYKWFFHHMSGDGNTIIWWSQDLTTIRIYKHNSGTNAWDEITHSFSSTAQGMFFRANLSYDGSILVIGDMAYDTYKGRVQVYERDSSDQFTKIGSDFVGTTTGTTSTGSRMGSSIAINKNGDVFSFNEHISNAWKNYVYKRDGSGWSQMGDISTESADGQHTMSLDDIGHSFTVGSSYHQGQPQGKFYIFEYNTTDSTWSHIITNNSYQGGGYYNGYDEGNNSPILGTLIPAGYLGGSIQLSGDNSKLIVCGPSYMHIYSMPGEVVTSTSSTHFAGDSFINNFVSKISTDINQSLSYDADNKNITFDGISENIEISITSTDTTVFDTSITEITVAENTLPFITYGKPEPSYFQYSLNGITYHEFIANGISATELTGVLPGWNRETDANQFDKSYVLGFMDVSGYMAIRNDSDMVVMGNTTIDGTINMQEDKTLSSSILSVDSRLFANGDISANGKLYVGSDLSINGQFSSNFAGNSIPYSKIKDSPIITGDVKIGEDVSFNGPTVELGSGATLKLSGTTEFNDNTAFDADSIRFSGTIVGGNMVFKDTTISSVIVNGSASATTVTSSDYRIKSNVTELNETHTVDTLEPIYYENTLTGNHEYGLIAHELQAEYPDLVINEKDGDEYQSVNYDGLIGVLVKEIQDLKKRLNVLNNK